MPHANKLRLNHCDSAVALTPPHSTGRLGAGWCGGALIGIYVDRALRPKQHPRPPNHALDGEGFKPGLPIKLREALH